MKRRFEFQDDKSNKFWEIELEGSSVTTSWGRIGTAGQSKAKDFGSPEKAKIEYDKLLIEKTGKGYVETGSQAAAQNQPSEAAGLTTQPAIAISTANLGTTPKASSAPKGRSKTGQDDAEEVDNDNDDDDTYDEEEDDDETARSSGRRRFELVEGNSSKFWEIKLDEEEQSVTTWWGRIGTNGKSKLLEFESEEEASLHYEKLIKEKMKKGYEEVIVNADGAPETFAIDHDDYHAEHVGRTVDGKQFFLTTPFEPGGNEFVALFLFDEAGKLVEAKIDNFGPRGSLDEGRSQLPGMPLPLQSVRSEVYNQRLQELGQVSFERIVIRPFSIERFGTTFGFIAQEPEDEDGAWCVELHPGNFMAFYEPWDSGEYDT